MQMETGNGKKVKVGFSGSSPGAAPAASPGLLDPMNLLRMVLHRWILVMLLAIAGGLVGILYCELVTPVYKAEAQLEMSVRRPRVTTSEAVFDDSSAGDSDSIFNTRFAKFKSPAMERLAAREYSL